MLESLANIVPILALVLGFGFLIFIHELGHFLVAKWVGIRCTQFAIGFGHAILTWRKGIGFHAGSTEPEYEKRARRLLKDEGADLSDLSEEQLQRRIYEAGDRLGLGETEYRLNWMPLGGYVKMLGQEDMDPTARSDDPRAFNRKPVWARAAVISAGVTMNLIFGLLFFIIAFMLGVRFPPAIIGGAVPGSPAATAVPRGHADDPDLIGLRPGDRVLAFNDKPVTDFADIAVNTALSRRGQTIALTIERPGRDEPLVYEMKPVPEVGEAGKLLAIGVTRPVSLTIADFGGDATLDGTLSAAGVQSGDQIIAVAGEPVERFDQYADRLEAARGLPVEVTFADPTGATRTVALKALPTLARREGQDYPNLLGLMPVMSVFMTQPGSRAAAAGLQTGDVFYEIDGVLLPSLKQGIATISAAANRPIRVRVLRGGEIVDLGTPMPDRHGKLGFNPATATHLPLIADALEGTSAASLEITPGSRLLAVNGEPVADWGDAQRLMADATAAAPDGGVLQLTIERDIAGRPRETLELSYDADDARALAQAGWAQPIIALEDLKLPITAGDPWAATLMGLHKTKQFILQTYVTLYRLFQQTVPVQELRGPVGIFEIGVQTASQKDGMTYLLFFLGLISVNLVVINFLPIPIVDGGLMLFLIIEKIKGSPVSPRVLAIANWIGLALIGTVMLMTLYFDISRL